MNVGHAGRNVLPELELIAAFEDFDRAQFARPIVDVLEQVAVDGTKMGQIE